MHFDFGNYTIFIAIAALVFFISYGRVFRGFKQYGLPKVRGNRTLLRVWWPMSYPVQEVYLGESSVEIVYKNVSTVIDFGSVKGVTIQPLIVPHWVQGLLWVKRNDIHFLLAEGQTVTVYNMTEKQTNNILRSAHISGLHVETLETRWVILIQHVRNLESDLSSRTQRALFWVILLVALAVIGFVAYSILNTIGVRVILGGIVSSVVTLGAMC